MLIVKNKTQTTHYGPQYSIEELGPLSSGEERGFRGGRGLRLVPAEESLRLFWFPLLRRKRRPRRRGVKPAAVSVTRETEIRPAPVRAFDSSCRSNRAIPHCATRVPGASLPVIAINCKTFCSLVAELVFCVVSETDLRFELRRRELLAITCARKSSRSRQFCQRSRRGLTCESFARARSRRTFSSSFSGESVRASS